MKKSEVAFSVSLLPLDYLMVVFSGLVAYFLRYWQPIQSIRPVIFDLTLEIYLSIILLAACLWPASFVLAGLYAMKGNSRTVDEIFRIILGCSTAVAALMFIFFFSRSLFDSRFIILAVWLISIVFVILGRGLVRSFQRYLYRFGVGLHYVVVLGQGALVQEATQLFQNNAKAGYQIVGQFPDFTPATEKQLAALTKSGRFDEILVVTPKLSAKELERLNDFSYIYHINLKFVADIFDFPIANFEINTVSGLPIVEVKKTRLDGWGRIYKRIFDWAISGCLIILLSPLLLLIALAVKLSSSGPVFFIYQRIGVFGRPFTYFKFRSMIKDAHQYRFDKKFVKEHENLRQGTPMIKFKDDPRVTRVGRFIRRFSLDELPELFNVFIGRMSLVGPRPHEIEEVARYQTHHKKVLTIRPGITGLAQVSGRSDLDFEEEIRLDTWYMENWSPKLDLMILFRTPWAIVKKRRAE